MTKVQMPPTRQRREPGLRVICVKWGDKYSDEYVHNLKYMVEQHIPHREFVCITDRPVEGVMCNPLVCDWPGWWQKVGLFQPGLFPGDNLYLDLDVVITAPLDIFVACLQTDPDKLWALDDFSYSLRNPRQGLSPEFKRKLGGDGTVNSSVMLWRGSGRSVVPWIWKTAQKAPELMNVLHGDQNLISQVLWPGGIRLLPDGYAKSWKYGRGQKAPIVVFHGDPKPHEVNCDWVTDAWRGAALSW